jgi:ribosomal protein S18 acetylase RimI-like enzyme
MHAARLYTAVLAPGVETNDVGGRLMRSVEDAARRSGAQFILAEMPDDPAIGSVLGLLREQGFREEARIPDFFREGVALTFLRLSL